MAKIPKSGIANAQTIQASHITNIIEALDGTGSYDIDATGSFTGSFEGNGSGLTGIDPFPYTGSAVISGSLLVTGSINGRFTKDSIAVDNNSSFAGNISGSGIYSGMNTMIDLSQSLTNFLRFTLSPITEYALGSSYAFYLSTTLTSGSAFFRILTSGGGEVFQGTITAFTSSISVNGDTKIETNGGSGDSGDRIKITKISNSIWQVEGSIKSGSSWTVS